MIYNTFMFAFTFYGYSCVYLSGALADGSLMSGDSPRCHPVVVEHHLFLASPKVTNSEEYLGSYRSVGKKRISIFLFLAR
jgi:hypothetical protein